MSSSITTKNSFCRYTSLKKIYDSSSFKKMDQYAFKLKGFESLLIIQSTNLKIIMKTYVNEVNDENVYIIINSPTLAVLFYK